MKMHTNFFSRRSLFAYFLPRIDAVESADTVLKPLNGFS